MRSRFKILGRTQMLVEGQFDGKWGAPKPRGMLAALLLRPGRSMPVDELIEWVWPDGGELKQPAATFYTYATRIREALQRMDDPPKLIPGRGSYRIDVTRDDVDVYEFRGLAERARLLGLQGDHNGAREILESCVDMWSDQPLTDLEGEPAREWRRWAEADLWIPAHCELMHTLLALGEFGEVLRQATDLPVEYQANLTVVQRKLEALYGLHREREAVPYYFRMRKQMLADGDQDGADELRRFHDQLLGRSRERESVEVTVRAELAPPVPYMLPHDVPDFGGREDLLDQLSDLVAATGEPATGIVGLSGEPGVGKSAIAVHWAHCAADRFPGGQLYVNLNGFSGGPKVKPAAVVDSFLAELGFPPERIPDVAGRGSKLRSLLSGRRALVLLDDASDSDHILPLLEFMPCFVVVTSSRRLNGLSRRGATNLSVAPLGYPDSRTWLVGRMGERALNEPGALTEIVGLCGGNSLALRLMVEHVNGRPRVSLADFVDELRDAHALLSLGDAGDDPGGSVRAAFSRSYRALDKAERRLFRLLGVHPGPDISLEVAAALAGTDPLSVRRGLDALVNACLVTQPEQRGRYGFHSLMRKFAAECISSPRYVDERAVAEERMLNFYHHGANNADMTVFPYRRGTPPESTSDGVVPPFFVDDVAAIEWSVRERANLNSAILYAHRRGFGEYAKNLPTSCGEIYELLGCHDDVMSMLNVGLDASKIDGDRDGQANYLNNIGLSYLNYGDFESAVTFFAGAGQLYHEIGLAEGSASVLHNQGRLLMERGEYRRGIDAMLESLVVFRRIGEQGREIIALSRLGEAYRRSHNLEAAISYSRDGLWLAEKFGDEVMVSHNLAQLGAVYLEKGDLTGAKGYLARALSLQQRLRILKGVGSTSLALAAICREERDLPEAERYASSAVVSCRNARDVRGEAMANERLAEIRFSQGRHDEAVQAWRMALIIYQDMSDSRADSVRQQLTELAAALPAMPPEQTRPLAGDLQGRRVFPDGRL